MTTLNTICHECGEVAVRETVLERATQVNYEGVAHDVSAVVPAYVCSHCGAKYFDYRADDLLRRALREKLHLLHPEEIAELRDQYGLTQRAIAAGTGIAPESITRWINDHVIQSRANDRLLRYFFDDIQRNSCVATTTTGTFCDTYLSGGLDDVWEWAEFDTSHHTPCPPAKQYALAA